MRCNYQQADVTATVLPFGVLTFINISLPSSLTLNFKKVLFLSFLNSLLLLQKTAYINAIFLSWALESNNGFDWNVCICILNGGLTYNMASAIADDYVVRSEVMT